MMTTGTMGFIPTEDGEKMKIWLCDVCKGFKNHNRMGSTHEGCMCEKECRPKDGECINTRFQNRATWYRRVLDLQPTDRTIEWVDENCPSPVDMIGDGNHTWLLIQPWLLIRPSRQTWQRVPLQGGNYGERMDQLEKHIKCLDEKLDHHINSKIAYHNGRNN